MGGSSPTRTPAPVRSCCAGPSPAAALPAVVRTDVREQIRRSGVAAEHGAVGCIIYSDPKDDGYALLRLAHGEPVDPARAALIIWGGWLPLMLAGIAFIVERVHVDGPAIGERLYGPC